MTEQSPHETTDDRRAKKELYDQLQNYRVVFVGTVLLFSWLTVQSIFWFQEHHKELTEAGAAGYIGIVLSCVAAVKWAMEKSAR